MSNTDDQIGGQMKAFHAQEAVKEKYLARVRAHAAADELVKGQYWQDGKGCAVGCTIHGSDHGAYEKELGIPRILAKLEDGIFEGLPNELAMTWPERFLSSIPVGADLSGVWPRFAVWLLMDKRYGVLRFAHSKSLRKAITDIADAYRLVIQGKGEDVNWVRLRNKVGDAYDAADGATYDAAVAVADAAAYDAAYAATAYAAAVADVGHAGTATKNKCRVAQSKKLLELLAAAPVTRAASMNDWKASEA